MRPSQVQRSRQNLPRTGPGRRSSEDHPLLPEDGAGTSGLDITAVPSFTLDPIQKVATQEPAIGHRVGPSAGRLPPAFGNDTKADKTVRRRSAPTATALPRIVVTFEGADVSLHSQNGGRDSATVSSAPSTQPSTPSCLPASPSNEDDDAVARAVQAFRFGNNDGYAAGEESETDATEAVGSLQEADVSRFRAFRRRSMSVAESAVSDPHGHHGVNIYEHRRASNASSACTCSQCSAEGPPILQPGSPAHEASVSGAIALEGRSMGVFGPRNRFRLVVHRFVWDPITQAVIVTLIWVSFLYTFFLNESLFLRSADFAILFVFSCEILMKWISMGVLIGSTAFFRHPANILDFIVVAGSVIALMLSFSSVKALRVFRAMRPLRTLPVLQGLAGILDSMKQSLPVLFDNLCIVLFFVLFCAVIGIEIFGDLLNTQCVLPKAATDGSALPQISFFRPICTNRSDVGVSTCPDTLSCIPYSDTRGRVGFDSMGRALLTMFQVVTLSDWGTGVMLPLASITAYFATATWFIGFVVVVNFVLVNIFVAITTAVFAGIRERRGQSGFLSRSNKHLAPPCLLCLLEPLRRLFRNARQRVLEPIFEEDAGDPDFPPYRPSEHAIRQFCAKMIAHRWFTPFICFLIVFNVAVQASPYDGMSAHHERVVAGFEIFFLVVFVLEQVVKMIALYPRKYVRSRQNLFDLALALLSIPGAIVTSVNISFFRVIRLFRVFRLLLQMDDLTIIVNAALKGVRPVINLIVFILLAMFIITVVGMEFFSNDVLRTFPNARRHFGSVGQSLLTLFVILTGDGWQEIMYQTMAVDGDASALFFVAYYCFATWVMLNMFTTLIVENFAIATEEMENSKRRRLFMSKPHTNRIKMVLKAMKSKLLACCSAAFADPDAQCAQGASRPGSADTSAAAEGPHPLRPVKRARATLVVEENYVFPPTPNVGREQPSTAFESVEIMVQPPDTPGANGRRQSPIFAMEVSCGDVPKKEDLDSDPDDDCAEDFQGDEDDCNNDEPTGRRCTIADDATLGPTERASLMAAEPEATSRETTPRTTGTVPVPPRVPRFISFSFPPRGDEPADTGSSRTNTQTTPRLNGGRPGRHGSAGSEVSQPRSSDASSVPMPAARRLSLLNRNLQSRASFGSDHRSSRSASVLSRLEYSRMRSIDVSLVSRKSVRHGSSARLHTQRASVAMVGDAVPGQASWLRNQARRVVESRFYESGLLVLVAAGIVSMALEPHNNNAELRLNRDLPKAFLIADILYFLLFCSDLFFKAAAFGLWVGPDSYLRERWNILDVALLVAMLLAFVFPAAKTFRIMRVLRALRFVRHIPSLRHIVYGFWSSIVSMLHIFTLILFFLFLFGLLGMGIFSGTLHYCTDATVRTKAACTGTFPISYDKTTASETSDLTAYSTSSWSYLSLPHYPLPRAWANADLAFDNTAQAMLTLFRVGSLDHWTSVMYPAMDYAGVDRQPERDANPAAAIYFIVFIVVVTFFLGNIFISVVVQNIAFNRNGGFVTRQQKRWVNLTRQLLLLRPHSLPLRPRSRAPLHWLSFRIATSAVFRALAVTSVLVTVLCTLLLFCLPHSGATGVNGDASPRRTWELPVFWALTIEAAAEVAVEFFAFGHRRFLSDRWNAFHSIVVCAMAVSRLAQGFAPREPLVLACARAIPCLRLFRLVPLKPGMAFLFSALVLSLPSVVNLIGLVGLLTQMHALIGTAAFGNVRHGSALNPQVNFRHYGNSLLVLFKNLTLDNWVGLMIDVMRSDTRYCTRNSTWDDCGSAAGAVVYFLSFYILGTYIFKTLVISIILDNFEHCFSQADPLIPRGDVHQYQMAWNEYDRASKGFIRRWQFLHLMQRLECRGSSLSHSLLGDPESFWLVYYEMTQLSLHRTGKMGFHTLLYALAVNSVNDQYLPATERVLKQTLAELIQMHVAQRCIAACWKRYQCRLRCRNDPDHPLTVQPGLLEDVSGHITALQDWAAAELRSGRTYEEWEFLLRGHLTLYKVATGDIFPEKSKGRNLVLAY
eukprot:TRINITY_DN21007_c0_g1_i1.p1 TRINITY_DN21007_c0_g1~~TRINITY_DN21007_c0_g1_i1.p1  ORF type:complete len:2015 (+),score=238.43 TRINITY_DN21007_c0_g1_i1:84-6128(+)